MIKRVLRLKDKDLGNIIEDLQNHVQKVAPYLTLYSALMTVAAVFITISQLSELRGDVKSLLKLSGVIFAFAAFSGVSGIAIYLYLFGQVTKSYVKALINALINALIILSFALFVFGVFVYFLFTSLIAIPKIIGPIIEFVKNLIASF